MDVRIHQILEPVLNENGEACWLTRRIEKVGTSDLNKTMSELILENKPLQEIKIFELQQQELWRCKKCGAYTQSNPHEPLECSGCNRKSQFNQVTKSINPDLWKLPKWKDTPNINTKEMYDYSEKLYRKTVIHTEEIHYKLNTLYDISTYKIEHWDTVGFPFFLGIPESGKTVGLDWKREVCWRMIDAGAGITFPAIVRNCHLHTAGMLLDEAHDNLDPKTETGKNLTKFIKPSYRRGNHYIVADLVDQTASISYNNFGNKAFASEKPLGHAFMTRTITFEMEQDYPEIKKLGNIKNELDIIQNSYLNYRFYTDSPPEVPDDCELKGRILEIYEPIIRTGLHLGVDVQDVIDYAKKQKDEETESLQNTIEWNVLNAIKNGEENQRTFDAPEQISYREILNRLGWEEKTEDGKSNAQRIGYILNKTFNLKTKRMTEGTVLLLNHDKNTRKLKYLYRRYKL